MIKEITLCELRIVPSYATIQLELASLWRHTLSDQIWYVRSNLSRRIVTPIIPERSLVYFFFSVSRVYITAIFSCICQERNAFYDNTLRISERFCEADILKILYRGKINILFNLGLTYSHYDILRFLQALYVLPVIYST